MQRALTDHDVEDVDLSKQIARRQLRQKLLQPYRLHPGADHKLAFSVCRLARSRQRSKRQRTSYTPHDTDLETWPQLECQCSRMQTRP